MKAVLVALTVLCTASLRAQSGSAPDILPLNDKGIAPLIASHAGKVLVLNFWATWCKPCLEEFPGFLKLRRAYASRGLEVVFVSIDDDARAKQKVTRFLKKNNVSFPTYLKQEGNDEQFINAVNPEWSGALPATFIYDIKGKLVESKIEESTYAELEAIVLPLLRK